MGDHGVRDNSCRDLLSCREAVRFCKVGLRGDLEAVAADEYDGFVGEGLTTEDYHTESHTGCTPNRLDRKTAGEDGELCWSWPDCGLDEPPSSCGKT